jgi:hypothetical protein
VGYASKNDLKGRVVVSSGAAASKKFWTAPPLSLLRVHIQQQRENRSKGGQAKRAKIPKSCDSIQDQAQPGLCPPTVLLQYGA